MTKKLHLIYGEDTALMKQVSAAIRIEHKNVDVNLRSALLFTPDQVEIAESVMILGSFPAIEAAYTNITNAGMIPDNEIPEFVKRLEGHVAEATKTEGDNSQPAPLASVENKKQVDKIEDMTVPQIKEKLIALKVNFVPTAKRAVLVELLKAELAKAE